MSSLSGFTNLAKDDPILLVLDGHYSYTRNIEILNMANRTYFHCLPFTSFNTQDAAVRRRI